MDQTAHSPALDALLQKLKQAREARQMTLSDVADATLIGLHFLEQLEQGITSFLPQTYVRAFVREYASVVGLDQDAIIQEYDAATSGSGQPAPPAAEEQPAPAASIPREASVPAAAAPAPDAAAAEGPTRTLGLLQFGAAVVIIAVVGVVIWNVLGPSTPPVEEVPFSSVIAENERQAAPALPESTMVRTGSVARLDSLVLRGRTTDSVWMRMQIDDLAPREYYIWPNRTRTWKARDRFVVIAMGNPTAIQFTLNGKQLGPLGRKGTIVRDKELNRATLEQQR